MNKTVNFPPELQQTTDSVIENLVASEPLLVYQHSQVTMNSDSQARSLLERLSTLQTQLRRKQHQQRESVGC